MPQPSPAASPQQLQDFILDKIPLARAMQLRIHDYQADRIEVRAPLAPNVNDKGCAFGGSLSSLMTLAPWALLELGLREAGLDADLFVARAEIRYLAPVWDEIAVIARPAENEAQDMFQHRLLQRGRARIATQSVVHHAGEPACRQQATFVAKLR